MTSCSDPVLSMDSKIWDDAYEGIKRMNIIDFLLDTYVISELQEPNPDNNVLGSE